MRFDDWNNDELYHHGIKGQKWGIRRFQNEDGSLTAEGQARYNRGVEKFQNKLINYKKRESAYEEKGYAKTDRKIEKKINRLSEKSNKANLAGKLAKVQKVDKKISELKEQQDIAKRIHNRVIDRLQNLSYDDMQQEKKKAGKQVAIEVLAGAASSAVVFFASGGVYVPVVIPSSLQYKRSANRNIDAAFEIANEELERFINEHK